MSVTRKGKMADCTTDDAFLTKINTLSDNIPSPSGSGHLDQVVYRSVHFYGTRLSGPLAEAARYVEKLERLPGPPPHVLCVYDEFSGEDEGSEIAWRVTVVFSEKPPD